jgi:hypothetical protein
MYRVCGLTRAGIGPVDRGVDGRSTRFGGANQHVRRAQHRREEMRVTEAVDDPVA